MKRISRWCVFLSIPLALLLLAGCRTPSDPDLPSHGTAAPIELGATAADEKVTLTWSWQNGGDISESEVSFGFSGFDFDRTMSVEGSATTAIVTGLTNDTTYQFRVRSLGPAGWSGFSATVTATPVAPLTPPEDAPDISFDATRMGSGEIFVRWDPVAGAGFYNVRFGTTNVLDDAQTWLYEGEEDIVALYTLITGLNDDTVYYVWVRAGNDVGPGPWESDSIRTVPGLPEGITTDDITVTTTGIAISWEVPQGLVFEIGFGLIDDVDGATPWETGVTETGTTITGLTNNTIYFVWIRTRNETGAGDWLRLEVVTLPVAPTGLTLIPANGQLTAQWNAFPNSNANITEFEVQYRLATGTWDNFDTATVTRTESGIDSAAVITGLPNVAHFVRVRARNSGGWSGVGAHASGTPAVPGSAPAMPSGFAISTRFVQGELHLTWDAVIGAQTYDVRYGLSNDANDAGDPVSVDVPSFTLSDLDDGVEYFFWVRATNNIGSSGWAFAGSGSTLAPAVEPELTLSTGTVPGTIVVGWVFDPAAASHDVRFGITNVVEDASPWGNVTPTGTTITGLYDAQTYYIWVRAVNNIGPSGWATGYEHTMVPTPSLSVVSFNDNTGELVLRWTTLNNPDAEIGYILEVDIANNFNDAEETELVDGAHTLTVTVGFTYFVRVMASTPLGESAWSNAVSRTQPLPMSIQMPVISQDAQDAAMRVEVTVSWDPVPGVTGYRVWYTAADNVIPTIARRRALAIEHAEPVDPADPSVTLPGRYHNTSVYWMWVQMETARGVSVEHMIPIPTGGIKLNALTGIPIFNYIYIEMNQTDPRVALSYALGNDPNATGFAARNAGRPLFDAVILFAANLRDRDCVAERAAWLAANPGRQFRNHDCNQSGIHLHFNGNHAFLYGGGMTMEGAIDTYIRPIQAQGIRTIMGLLPDWGGFSFTSMGEWVYEDIAPVAGPGHPHLGPQDPGRCNRGAAPPANWVDDAGQPYYRFNHAARSALIDQIGAEVERLGLDGVDLDCEWANASGRQYDTLWWTVGWCHECNASHSRWNYLFVGNLPPGSGGIQPPGFGAGTGVHTNRVTWPEGNRWGHPGGTEVTSMNAAATATWRNTIKARNASYFIAEMRYVLNGIQSRTGRRQMLTVYEYGWMGHVFAGASVTCPRSGANLIVGDLIDYSAQPFYGTWTADSRLARAEGTNATSGAVLLNNRYAYSPMAIDLGHGHDTTVRPNWTAITGQATQLMNGGYGVVFMYGLLERDRYHSPAVVSPLNPAYGQDALGNHRRHRPNFFQAPGRNPEDYLTRFTEIVWGQPTVFTGQDFPMNWLEFSNDRQP